MLSRFFKQSRDDRTSEPTAHVAGDDLARDETVLAQEAMALAQRLPDLLVQATSLSSTIISGWHGRRRSGMGENFWQYRHLRAGEPAHLIDWRRSGRDDVPYVREQEWEAAHTVWLWVDLSPSMLFCSDLARVSKRDRAIVITLALADLLARGGERVGLIGYTRPEANRHIADKLALALAAQPTSTSLPDLAPVRRFSDIVLISDFLSPLAEFDALLDRAGRRGSRVHLLQVLDPIEETFPFTGRVEFQDPESGHRLLSGKAETMREGYLARLAERRDRFEALGRRLGWTAHLHHTDHPVATPLTALHAALGAETAGAEQAGTMARAQQQDEVLQRLMTTDGQQEG